MEKILAKIGGLNKNHCVEKFLYENFEFESCMPIFD